MVGRTAENGWPWSIRESKHPILLPASMHHAPFFTALDPDARLKGSRDPLGFERIWTAFGREIIGNLTTVTQSVRQFSTLLFGFHLANQATESLADRDEEFLPAFLRFEQLAAYARYRGD